MTIHFNYQNNEIVSSPSVIVSGSTSSVNTGVVTFVNNNNKIFPPQNFEVNNGQFKALVHVSPGEVNEFKVEVFGNCYLNAYGFIEGNGQSRDKGSLSLVFNELPQNKPIHLCIIVGGDGSYDMPKYRTNRGEHATLSTAIAKLKVAGRLMQAYTQDEMRSVGFSNRSFQFVEETQDFQSIFGYDVKSPAPHKEVKVHVLRSPKSASEIRDVNLAQQNPKATDSGGLFSHALDLIKNTPEIYDKRKHYNTAVQCAVIYLDSHYDVQKDMILGHAALGGGDGDVKLAIFGSHGLHSWPINFPQVTPSFLDQTRLSKNEVANDANQCGTSWECLNITLGAFMHEIGHLLGCPHQVDGVMLRDYIWFNRSFMTREGTCLRTNTNGAVIGPNGIWPSVCHWNKLDLIRFLYHGSFSLPIDNFPKVYSTTYQPDDSYPDNTDTTTYHTPKNELIVKSAGIYLIEIIVNDLARSNIVFYPQSYGGQGNPKEYKLDYNTCYQMLRSNSRETEANFDVKILSINGEKTISKFKDRLSGGLNTVKGDFGLGRGTLTGYKSQLLGREKDKSQKIIGFDIKSIYKVRVYHGFALDGVRFYFKRGEPNAQPTPSVPPRNYLKRFSEKLSKQTTTYGESDASVVIGNEKDHYTEFNVPEGQYITRFHFRDGAWVDAIQFETNTGLKSPMYGNATGGHASTLEAPDSSYTIIGMYGYTGDWMDGLGIIYAEI